MQLPRLFLTTALISMTTAATAQADNFPYWYLGLHGQLSYVNDADVNAPALGTTEVDFDTGYALGGALGYRPGLSGVRLELEYSYRDVEVGSAFSAGTSANIDADLLSHNLMLNAFYDIDTGSNWTPYIGGGFGIAFAELNSSTLGLDDSDEVFAYQGMVGLSYAPETLPDTEWGFGYRYVGMSDPSLTDSAGNAFEHEYSSHNIELMARFRF